MSLTSTLQRGHRGDGGTVPEGRRLRGWPWLGSWTGEDVAEHRRRRLTGALRLLVPRQAKPLVCADAVCARRPGEGAQVPGAQGSAPSRPLSPASKLTSAFKKISSGDKNNLPKPEVSDRYAHLKKKGAEELRGYPWPGVKNHGGISDPGTEEQLKRAT